MARLKIRGRCSKKNIKQLNRGIISVSLGLGLVLRLWLGLVLDSYLGLVLGLMLSEKYRPLIFTCPQFTTITTLLHFGFQFIEFGNDNY